MNFSSALALLAASVGLYVALLAWRFRRAPGLEDQAWFALVALTTSAYTGLDVITVSTTASDQVIVWGAKLQLLMAVVHVLAWLLYASAFLRRPWRHQAAACTLLLAAGLPLLLPGVGYTGEVRARPQSFLGIVYRDAEPSTYGLFLLVLAHLAFLAVIARFTAAWRRGVPHAAVHVAALGLLFAMAVNDALNVAGVLHGIYLLDLGFLAPVAAVTYGLSGRVVEGARALVRQWAELDQTVTQRTAELAASRDALHRAEKLAALGQFSAGVSHEVSNPAAVVAANLRYLEEGLGDGVPPPDTLDCLRESREAVDRIARLTRQLLDASRLAAAPQALGGRLVLSEVVAQAMAATRAQLEGREVRVSVPTGLCALGQPQALTQVLERLLDNAARSLPPGAGGRLTIHGERTSGRARLVVEDDGEGMSPETLRRAFDPFFTTRAFGTGKGLGLSVARGLVQSMRGDLRLESAPGGGTRAIVELPLAES